MNWDSSRKLIKDKNNHDEDTNLAPPDRLNCNELRYILDPKGVYRDDFLGASFWMLKEKEFRLYGEYETRQLVPEAWSKLGFG